MINELETNKTRLDEVVELLYTATLCLGLPSNPNLNNHKIQGLAAGINISFWPCGDYKMNNQQETPPSNLARTNP
jgi:hypothetical protein